jgi:hypothetical protein
LTLARIDTGAELLKIYFSSSAFQRLASLSSPLNNRQNLLNSLQPRYYPYLSIEIGYASAVQAKATGAFESRPERFDMSQVTVINFTSRFYLYHHFDATGALQDKINLRATLRR